MQSIKYVCDGCCKDIGDKKHISIVTKFGYTGVAMPPKKKGLGWKVESTDKHFWHFHSGDCAKIFFDTLLKTLPLKK